MKRQLAIIAAIFWLRPWFRGRYLMTTSDWIVLDRICGD